MILRELTTRLVKDGVSKIKSLFWATNIKYVQYRDFNYLHRLSQFHLRSERSFDEPSTSIAMSGAPLISCRAPSTHHRELATLRLGKQAHK